MSRFEAAINQINIQGIAMAGCPCGSQQEYSLCCEPYLTNKRHPETPEALMRSRYAAYCLDNMDYIQASMRGRALVGFDAVDAKRVSWIKLEVLNTTLDTPHKGYVEFVATFMDNHILKSMHEKSEFIREEGRWYYVDGVQYSSTEATSKRPISRNSLCPCGSLRKYKNCHEKP